jgi:DNA-binding transcriptional regulator LsrR (DeoR family)
LDSSSTPITAERLELLARIAGMYYEDRLTQEQIAAQTGYSRSMVSRLLTEARDQEVVEIHINHPLERRRDLEETLQSLLSLKVVQVLARGTLNYTHMLRRLGSLAARFIEDLIFDNATIGVSWGTAVSETINAMRPRTRTGIHVVQMIGSLGPPDPDIDGPELARRLARVLGGQYSTFPVPLFVDSEATREMLMNDTRVQRVTAHFKDVDLALLGVGTVEAERSSLLRGNYLGEAQLAELQQAGAVGDVAVIHFDIHGQLTDIPLAHQVMGIDPETLRERPLRVGIAGGQLKSRPILGASRAGLINMLVTDEVAASGVLQLLRAEGFA